MVFIDSDLIIKAMRPFNPKKPKTNLILEKARDVLNHLTNNNQKLRISLYNLAELYQGAYLSKEIAINLSRIEEFISRFEIIYPTLESIKEYARISAELEKSGQVIGDLDVFIASIVITNHDTLYTNNITHFDRIPQLKSINWENYDTSKMKKR